MICFRGLREKNQIIKDLDKLLAQKKVLKKYKVLFSWSQFNFNHPTLNTSIKITFRKIDYTYQ